MVKLMDGFPDHVVAYRAQGKINHAEYEQIIVSRINEVADRYGILNFIVLLETGMEDYSLHAFMDYLKISFKHFKKWSRMAIVSDQRWLRIAYRVLSPLVHGEIRCYVLADFEQAKAWVSGPPDRT